MCTHYIDDSLPYEPLYMQLLGKWSSFHNVNVTKSQDMDCRVSMIELLLEIIIVIYLSLLSRGSEGEDSPNACV